MTITNEIIWTDVAQVVTAVAALFVAAWAVRTSQNILKTQRQHNYKSFEPVPYLRLGNFKRGIKVELSNEGVGPLFVKNIEVIDTGKSGKGSDIVSLLPKEKDPVFWDRYASNLAGRVIPPNSSITLLSLFDEERDDDPAYDAAFAQFILEARTRLAAQQITLKFTDLYGRTFPKYKQNLTWMHPGNAGSLQPGSAQKSRDEVGSTGKDARENVVTELSQTTSENRRDQTNIRNSSPERGKGSQKKAKTKLNK